MPVHNTTELAPTIAQIEASGETVIQVLRSGSRWTVITSPPQPLGIIEYRGNDASVIERIRSRCKGEGS